MTSEPDKVPTNEPGQSEPEVTAIPLRWLRVSHHTPDHIATRYPYAAYGSNLSLEQMVRRCGTSDIQGTGLLRDARLVFAYYLGIEQAENSSVPIGVYKVTAADVAALDRCEGLGRSYERYLVTVEVNGAAVRCFTYVKRDNALEEPSDRYYQTCVRGYADWNMDARRLRHARDHARKHGKRRTYSNGYGWYDGVSTKVDWSKYNGARDRRQHAATIPPVASYDDEEPEGNGTAASYQPRLSLVTGRDLNKPRKGNGIEAKHVNAKVEAFTKANRKSTLMPEDDPTRIAEYNASGQEEFTNPRTGEKWRKGRNGVWYRAK